MIELVPHSSSASVAHELATGEPGTFSHVI